MPEVSHSVVRLSVGADVPRASGERAIAEAAPHSLSWPFARTQGVYAAVLWREDEKIVGLIDLEDSLSVCLLPFCLGARTSLRI